MKKLNFYLIALLFGTAILFVTACTEEDDGDKPPKSTVTTYFSEELSEDCNGDGVDETYNIITVKDNGEGTGTMTWTKNNIYELDGFVFVNEGQTLTIEAGTIIKGKEGQGVEAAVLVVARGAKIMAEGTADDPIIFTSELDQILRDTTGALTCVNNNIPSTARNLWGGVLILGNASLNSTPGVTAIEGIPTTETRGIYGGIDDADDSGIFKYVSIRHGGTDISSNNEINGLTLAGVGNGTTVEYVEVIANKDDGVEFFGGTVNTKYIVVSYCEDDAFDYDEGWRGNNQYWLVLQSDDGADNGGEHDGGTEPEDATPYAIPVIYNATFYGNSDTRALRFRDNAGGKYYNSIFANFSEGVEIEKLESAQDSYQQYLDNNLVIVSNMFWNISGDHISIVGGSETDQADAEARFLGADANTIDINPGLVSMVPQAAEAMSGAVQANQEGLDNTTYKGCFDPTASSKWTDGWTLTSQLDLLN